jgi:hypothetical protein
MVFHVLPPGQTDKEAHLRQNVVCGDLGAIGRVIMDTNLPNPSFSTASTNDTVSGIEKGLRLRLCPKSLCFDLGAGTMASSPILEVPKMVIAWELSDLTCAVPPKG